MLEGTWPLELIEDPQRQPRVIDTASDFLRELLLGDHLEDFIVLPNGVELLDLRYEDSIPEDLRSALQNCRNACDFITGLRRCPEVVEKYRADIEFVDRHRQQRDILRKEKHDLGKRIDEALRMVSEAKADPALLYVAEMRHRTEMVHPMGGDKCKTVCRRDVKDVLGPYVAWTLYWDRYDEGLFVGGRRSGKGLHIDQVLWSNVARNWQGYKLVAAWPRGALSKQVAECFYDSHFFPPLRDCELEALRGAAKIAFIRPGDVYLFSGGIAHTALCVSEEMCIGAYESIVTLNPVHVEHFLHTDDTEGPYFLEKFSMESKDFEDTKEDCLDQLEDAAEQLESGGPSQVPVKIAGISKTWDHLRAQLNDDHVLQATLRTHYASAVQLCTLDKKYFAENLTDEVLQAAEACTSSKRRRLDPMCEDQLKEPSQAEAIHIECID
jgi:hypothetical protein